MKIGVLSDIHSNYYAFRACVDYMVQAGVGDFLLLGDYVSDTPYPERTMELIYELREKYTVHMLRGNREEYLLDQRAVQKEDGKYCVRILDGDTVQKRYVAAVKVNTEKMWILDGLSEGQLLIVN